MAYPVIIADEKRGEPGVKFRCLVEIFLRVIVVPQGLIGLATGRYNPRIVE